jgi:general secretion pathway protein D
MRSAIRPAAILLLLAAISLLALGESAKSLYKKAKEAEAKQNYEQAYDYMRQAYEKKPEDLAIRASFERIRFLAGASHVHRGQLLRDAGKLQEALAEFQKAADIDPSSFIAKQEIRRTQKLIEAAGQAPNQRSAKPEDTLEKRLRGATGPVELAAIPNVPITLKVTDDSKRIYETVGKLAGINVLFDPDYTSRRIPVELNGVTLEEAMSVIALESKTFWRPVTPNTIFVAADNPAKRRELEQSVLKTFYLSNLSQTTEVQEVVNTLRSILEIQKVQPLPSQGAIVVRGTPDQVLLAEKLINDLDRSKPEVTVEVAIMQISRDKKRNLGINPTVGTNGTATVQVQNNVNSSTGTSSSSAGGTGTTGQINLNRIGNLNATDFLVSLPSLTATALFSDANTKILQNPSIRSVDGQKASLKIGDRVPVATGSFQPGIGGVGINPLVNTQFQYLDVGVNIDITPRIHAGGEVSLKIAMDVSSVTSQSNIGGISQPVIGQRKIEHEITLKDGEPSMMGGMFEDQDIKSLSGIPGLAQVPLLKYLFSETDTEHRQNEIVFVLIPHIVRGPEYSDLNQSALEIGTGSSIDIRRTSAPASPQPAPAANTPAPSAAQPAQRPVAQPAAVQPAGPAAPQNSAAFSFDPSSIVQPAGSTFAVNVLINGAQNVYSVPLQVSYDPKVLQVVNVSNGGLLSQDGQAVALVHRDDDSTGTLQITATRPPGAGGISGGGAVVTLTFLAKGNGQSTLAISKGGARDPGMQAMPVAGAVGTVTVQ